MRNFEKITSTIANLDTFHVGDTSLQNKFTEGGSSMKYTSVINANNKGILSQTIP